MKKIVVLLIPFIASAIALSATAAPNSLTAQGLVTTVTPPTPAPTVVAKADNKKKAKAAGETKAKKSKAKKEKAPAKPRAKPDKVKGNTPKWPSAPMMA